MLYWPPTSRAGELTFCFFEIVGYESIRELGINHSYNKILRFCHQTSFYFHKMLYTTRNQLYFISRALGEGKHSRQLMLKNSCDNVLWDNSLFCNNNYYITENYHIIKINISMTEICGLNNHPCVEIVPWISFHWLWNRVLVQNWMGNKIHVLFCNPVSICTCTCRLVPWIIIQICKKFSLDK